MIGPVLEFSDLQKLCQRPAGPPPRRSTVEAWAKRIGLRYTYDGKGGIITTEEAVSVALGLRASNNPDQPKPEDLI